MAVAVALTLAICIPLWFYSERIIFNAQYRAAKSEILQSWLKESELELVEVDILRERSTFYMSLEGPTPPVNIGELHDELIADQPENEKVDFKIKYTWTQKVTGEWPQEAQSIGEVAERADAGIAQLTANSWVWSFTQYDANATARAEKGEKYRVSFTENGKFEVTANCRTWKASYSYRGESLDVVMHKNLLSGCRNDSILKIFLDDLDRARAACIRDNKLIVTMAVNGGTIYFQRQ